MVGLASTSINIITLSINFSMKHRGIKQNKIPLRHPTFQNWRKSKKVPDTSQKLAYNMDDKIKHCTSIPYSNSLYLNSFLGGELRKISATIQ